MVVSETGAETDVVVVVSEIGAETDVVVVVSEAGVNTDVVMVESVVETEAGVVVIVSETRNNCTGIRDRRSDVVVLAVVTATLETASALMVDCCSIHVNMLTSD